MAKRISIIGDIIAESHSDSIAPGGSAGVALSCRAFGADVTLRSVLGNDDAGQHILGQLKQARIHPKTIDVVDGPTSTATISSDGSRDGWTPGATLRRGAIMDVYDLFGHDCLVIDSLDQPLRRFLSDLPAHTVNNVRMITTLRHLDTQPPTDDDLEIAMRFDAIIGTDQQYAALTSQHDVAEALGDLFDRMPTTALHAAIAVTPDGVQIVSREDRVLRPIRDAVPALLVDHVTAATAWALANRIDWMDAATLMVDPEALPGG